MGVGASGGTPLTQGTPAAGVTGTAATNPATSTGANPKANAAVGAQGGKGGSGQPVPQGAPATNTSTEGVNGKGGGGTPMPQNPGRSSGGGMYQSQQIASMQSALGGMKTKPYRPGMEQAGPNSAMLGDMLTKGPAPYRQAQPMSAAAADARSGIASLGQAGDQASAAAPDANVSPELQQRQQQWAMRQQRQYDGGYGGGNGKGGGGSPMSQGYR